MQFSFRLGEEKGKSLFTGIHGYQCRTTPDISVIHMCQVFSPRRIQHQAATFSQFYKKVGITCNPWWNIHWYKCSLGFSNVCTSNDPSAKKCTCRRMEPYIWFLQEDLIFNEAILFHLDLTRPSFFYWQLLLIFYSTRQLVKCINDGINAQNEFIHTFTAFIFRSPLSSILVALHK